MIFKRKLKFAVLGAGHGGQAMAGHLALMGYEVNLYNKTPQRIDEIRRQGGIHISGIYSGFGKLHLATSDLGLAVDGVDIVMIVSPATAHAYFAEALRPFLKDGQMVVLNPGRTGGALEFSRILREGNQKKVIIAETQTFLYASRVIEPAHARIIGLKKVVPVAAFPSTESRLVYQTLHRVFPQFTPAKNILKTSLENIGAIFHPVPTLLNVGRIESTKGNFSYYHEGITPSVAQLLQKIDDERVTVAGALGVEVLSAVEWVRKVYDASGETLYEALQNNRHYDGINAPATVDHRYIFEDVPMSLVPIASLARIVNVPTPAIDTVVNMACFLHEKDYWATGRTVDSLGLAGMSVGDIHEYVETGRIKPKHTHSRVSRFPGNSNKEGFFHLDAWRKEGGAEQR